MGEADSSFAQAYGEAWGPAHRRAGSLLSSRNAVSNLTG